MDLSTTLLVAQQNVAPAEAGGAAEQAPSPLTFLYPLILTLFVFYFLVVIPERRRNKERNNLLASLKKNDRVITSGGMYGVVANVKPGDEVVLKVDEVHDVKVSVTKSSIAQVISHSDKEESPAKGG